MRVDRRLLNWGVFLVVLGAVPLAAHQGLIPKEPLASAWQLWPLLLVGSGVGLILSRTRLAFAGGLVVAATFGVILGGFIAGGFSIGSLGCGGSAAGSPVLIDSQHGPFGASARVDLRLDCGTLRVEPATSNEWTLGVTGDQRSRPTVSVGTDRLTVRSPGMIAFPPFTSGQTATWTVGLPVGPMLDLHAEVNAGDANLSLGGLTLSTLVVDANASGSRVDLARSTVGRIDLHVNAGDLRVTLPSSGTSGSISANAATVHLCAAPGAHLRFTTGDSAMSSDNFGSRGLIRNGGTWETPGVTGPVVDLRLDGNAASMTLDSPEDCR